MRRLRVVLAVSILAFAACKSLDDQVAVPVLNIPAGYTAFVFDPLSIRYHFTDTTAGNNVTLNWAGQPNFAGNNCIGLSPRSNGDTSGSYVFTYAGPNIGQLQRVIRGDTDTTQGFLLSPVGEPSHGHYYLTSTGHLNLVPADGPAGGDGRFFNPNSVITVKADTIFSDTDIKASGDSVHATWHVVWVEGICQ